MGLLEENIPQLCGSDDQYWVPDAVVRFADGGTSQFSRVKFVVDGQLLAELDCPVYLPGTRKQAGSVTERVYYADGVWESVAHAPVGVLTVIVDSGRQDVIESNVRQDALHEFAYKWIEKSATYEKERSHGKCVLVAEPEVRTASDVRIGVQYQQWRIGPDTQNEHVGTFEFRWLLPEGHDKPLRERASQSSYV